MSQLIAARKLKLNYQNSRLFSENVKFLKSQLHLQGLQLPYNIYIVLLYKKYINILLSTSSCCIIFIDYGSQATHQAVVNASCENWPGRIWLSNYLEIRKNPRIKSVNSSEMSVFHRQPSLWSSSSSLSVLLPPLWLRPSKSRMESK